MAPDSPAVGGTQKAQDSPSHVRYAVIGVVALVLAYIVLQAVELLVRVLWTDVPAGMSNSLLWVYIVVLPTLAGLVVAFIRSRGADGHLPLAGFSTAPIALAEYPTVLGAIVVSLAGGLVLGPEVALVSTGVTVGTVLGQKWQLPLAQAVKIGVIGAVTALFLGPILAGSFSVNHAGDFHILDIFGAVAAGVATCVLLFAGRHLALGVLRLRGGDHARIPQIAAVGLAVGLLALVAHLLTDQPVNLVLTSGEGHIHELLAVASVGAIALIVGIKWLAYALCLGGGFRGGPFFPAMFVGAGVGAVLERLVDAWTVGTVSAGLTAAVAYLMHANWKVTLGLGALLGLVTGGLAAVPLTIIGAVVGKLVPMVRAEAPAPAQTPATADGG